MSWSEPIRRSLDLVPLVPDCQWFLRNAVFAGVVNGGSYDDGRSYGDTAAVWSPSSMLGPADRRLTTIILPTPPTGNPYVGGRQYDIDTVVHELGHVMDRMTGFYRTCIPIGDYAATDLGEAFAEAFTAWLIPDYVDRWGHDDLASDDFAWFEASLR